VCNPACHKLACKTSYSSTSISLGSRLQKSLFLDGLRGRPRTLKWLGAQYYKNFAPVLDKKHLNIMDSFVCSYEYARMISYTFFQIPVFGCFSFFLFPFFLQYFPYFGSPRLSGYPIHNPGLEPTYGTPLQPLLIPPSTKNFPQLKSGKRHLQWMLSPSSALSMGLGTRVGNY